MYNGNNYNNNSSNINAQLNNIMNQIAAEKAQDRIHLLKIEIAKATDPRVKAKLEMMLDDIYENMRHQRFVNTMLGIIALIIIAGIAGVTYFTIQKEQPPTTIMTPTSSTSYSYMTEGTSRETAAGYSSDSTSASSTYQEISQSVNSLDLTSEQVNDWIYRHMDIDKANHIMDDYIFEQNIDEQGALRIHVTSKTQGVYEDTFDKEYFIDSQGYLRYGRPQMDSKLLAENYNE